MKNQVYKGARKVLLALVSAFLAFTPILAVPSQAHAANAVASLDSCDLIIDPVAKAICIAANGNLPGVPGIPNPGNIVAEAIVQPIMRQLVKAESEAVGESLNGMITFINTSTTPTLTRSWFTTQYAVLFGMATFLAVGLLFTRITLATKEQDTAEFGNSLISIVGFLGFAGLIPGVVSLSVAAADGPITQGMLDSIGPDATKKLTKLSTTLVETDIKTAVMVPLVVLFLGLIGGVLTELELFLRYAGIFVFTALSVFALALMVGGKMTADLGKAVFSGLIGLIMLKPIMALLMVLAVNMLVSDTTDAAPVFLGSIMLLVVPVVSWAIYKKVSNHDIHVSRMSRHAGRLARSMRA